MSDGADRTPTRYGVNFASQTAEVELASGLVIASPLSESAQHVGDVGRTDYAVADREQTITFHWGESATFEIGPVERPGAPVVYLDQNHWVELARQQWSPEKVPAPHRGGYARLLALARDRAIVVPLSAAHCFETARKDGRQRRQLGTTMLQLSRGWQMRSPLKVRREELLSSIGSRSPEQEAPKQRPVFTLDPHAPFSSSDYVEKETAAADLHARLTWAPALAEILVENKREDDEDGRAKAEHWASMHARLSTRMAEENASAEEKWATARMALLTDLTDELAAAAATAGLDRSEWEDWLAKSEDTFVSLPAIARVQQITHRRLCNPQHRWRANDLSDVHFLACAAGLRRLPVGREGDLQRSSPRRGSGSVGGLGLPLARRACRPPRESAWGRAFGARVKPMSRMLRFLDSKPLSRVGAVATLGSIATVGLALVGLMYVEGADLLREGKWITLACFGIWVVISALLIFAWAARRQPGIVVTPAARIAIAKGLPGSSGLLLAALARVEATGREFIAETAILMPINNHRAAYELAQGYAAFESEIAALIESTEVFDERWSLIWARKPSRYDETTLRTPLTLGMLNELTQYMAHRNRQLGWMLDFLQAGNDEPVRHARAWARADERAADASGEAQESRHIVFAGPASPTPLGR